MALVRKDKVKEMRPSVVVPSKGKRDESGSTATAAVTTTAGGKLCRLKCNMILEDGKLHARGEVIDDSRISDRFKNDEYIDYHDLGGNEGKVLVLLQLTYSGKPSLDGVSYPITVIPGDIVVWEDIPPRSREVLVEGTHYQTEWTEADVARVKQKEQAEEDKFFSMNKSYPLSGVRSF